MKNTKTMLMATVMMLGLAATVMAQPPERGRGGQDGERKGRGGDQFEQERSIRMMQLFPIMAALDADKDGTISAQEIARASKALGKLDTNGDGQLTTDEIRPQRPEGGRDGEGKGGRGKGGAGGKGKGGPGGGKGGPGGAGGGKGKGGAGGGKGKGGAGGKGKGGGGEGGGQRPKRPADDDGA